MNHSKLILVVIFMMTFAVRSSSTESDTIGQEADARIISATTETVVEFRIEMSFAVIPKHFEVGQNYPNPFNATTTIEFDLPQESGVFASVYNMLGRRVRILENNTRSPGSYQVEWDGRTDFGQPVTTGVYFFVLLSDDNYAIRKMLLLK